MKKKPSRTDWFTEARFGMFIHWGLYAMPARGEWIRHNEQISNENYEKYFERFDPDLLDAKAWAVPRRWLLSPVPAPHQTR